MEKLSLSLKAKLFLLRIGLGIVLALVVSMSSYFIARANLEKKTMNSLAFDAEISIERLQSFFEKKSEQLTDIATHPMFAKYSTTDRESLLLALFEKYADDFSSLASVDSDGNLMVRVVGGDITAGGEVSDRGINISGHAGYIRALQEPNAVVFSDLISSGGGGEGQVGLYLNATDFFDEPLGFLYATLSAADFKEIAGGTISNTGAFVVVLDGADKIVQGVYPDNTGKDRFETIRDRPDFKTLNSEALVLQDPSRPVEFMDRNWHLVSARAGSVDYKVVLWASHAQLYGPILKLRNTIFIIALVFVIVAELFARMLGLKVTEPIEELNRLTAEIAESGSMSKRVNWQSHDELGRLAHSFNRMLDKLEAAMLQVEKEQKFSRGVLSSMADMLAVVSTEGTVLTVNRSLCRLLEYAEEELVGEPVQKLFCGHTYPVSEEQLFDPAGSGVPFRTGLEYQTKGGEAVAVEFVRSTLVDHDGKVFGVVFVAKDMRSEKILEKERKKNEERVSRVKEELFRTEKMALVGQMSGMVAHEVLNPISAINVRVALNLKNSGELSRVLGVLKEVIGDWVASNASGAFSEYFAENGSRDLVLLKKIADMLEQKQEERREDLQFIEKLIARVIRTIDGFREMSRQRETIEEVSLSRVLHEILEDMQDGIRKRDIRVSTDIRDEVVLRADFMEMYSVLSNVIRNGIQAIDKRRDRAERAIRVSIERQAEGMARVVITDSGAGMDPHTREHVFEPDFTSKGRKGTGIGMSFSRKIARKYGGDIHVLESAINVGTTFEILLKGAEDTA